MAKQTGKSAESGFLLRNKKAYHLYTVLEKIEAGISLVGTEVKALRLHLANFADAYVRVQGNEATLENFHIGEFPQAGRFNHQPLRSRRLLLHKREILRLVSRCREKGLTLVPLALYLRGRRFKVEVGLVRGKKLHDKRDDLEKREATREMERALKGRLRGE